MIRFAVLVLVIVLGLDLAARAQDTLDIKIGYLRRAQHQETISLVQMPPPDNGLAGAQMATKDNDTTGRFLNQRYSLVDLHLKAGDDPATAVAELARQGISLIVADLPADDLLKAAEAGKAGRILFFNAAATDDRLRQKDCRANVIHTAPSRAMLADGLAQYLVWKRWVRWFLVVGSHERDKLFAAALIRAANRFGAKIVQEREFKDTGGARRTDSGVVQVQQQMPVFTQEAPSYDVLVAADESEVFANNLPYRTWDPRPVAGSAGLVPTSWDASNSLWGGIQMQDRFIAQFKRLMTPLDMQAWTAVRMIGEAASRQNSADPNKILDFLKGPELALGAFKGQKLTLRDWDLQLRQPILLADGRTIVSVSPQQGFLHQFSELDTLGYDRPETQCKLQK
ncbi:MAG TPA: ABC transporter substrate-binding protein [Pseudolabrys sp.]|nr:ABC transporter substrate-binding protein [Pseudolabrys sp.]